MQKRCNFMYVFKALGNMWESYSAPAVFVINSKYDFGYKPKYHARSEISNDEQS